MSPVTASSAAAVGCSAHSAERQPYPRIQLAVPWMRADSLERVCEAGRPFELHLALRERPGREVDVRVGEAGKDAAAAEIDDIRTGQRQLVRPDATRHVRAGDRERAGPRQRRIHRADDAVLEDH